MKVPLINRIVRYQKAKARVRDKINIKNTLPNPDVREAIIAEKIREGRISKETLGRLAAKYLDLLVICKGKLEDAEEEGKQARANLNDIQEKLDQEDSFKGTEAYLVSHGPDYPWFTPLVSFCISLIPSLNIASAFFLAFGLWGFLGGILAGGVLYAVLEKIYQRAMHNDLLKHWCIGREMWNGKKLKLNSIIIFNWVRGFILLLLAGLTLDFIFTCIFIFLRKDISVLGELIGQNTLGLQSSSGDVASLNFAYLYKRFNAGDYAILLLSTVSDLILMFFLYLQVSLNDRKHIKQFAMERGEDIGSIRQEYQAYLSRRKTLEVKKGREEAVISAVSSLCKKLEKHEQKYDKLVFRGMKVMRSKVRVPQAGKL